MTRLRRHLLRALGVLLLLPAIAFAEFPATQPFPGITYSHAERIAPPMRLFWVIVDLTSAELSVHVLPAGPDPDGDGPFQTTLKRTSEVAARDALDITVNGDFFATKPPTNAAQTLGYTAGQWATVTGPAMTDGRRWSQGRSTVPCFVVDNNRHASLVAANKVSADVRQVISGNVFLVKDGKKVLSNNTAIHPRTAVGLDEKATRLVLLIVDGRRPLLSVGMDYSQLADEMIRLGCHTAINLDGGGSSALVIYDPAARQHRVLNRPSDGPERPVANVLGIRCKTGSASTRPAPPQ
jgi:hypothetical protein